MFKVEEENGTDFLRFVADFGFRSRLEDVLDGKGEGPVKMGEIEEEREGEDEDKDDDSDDAEVEDSRPTNFTNESR
jgi:hypothetical protein